MRKNGFRVRMESQSLVEMEFYGVIGGMSFFEDDDYVNVTQVLKTLNDMGEVETLRMFYNSPGGDAYDGFQIANRLDFLREQGKIGKIEAHAEGLVASAATLPFVKSDVRIMRNGSRFMIHLPISFGMGNEHEMRSQADRLHQTTEEAIDLYETVANLDRAEIQKAMEVETWYSPKDAAGIGFATEVAEPFAIAACMSEKIRLNLLHLPDDLEVIDPSERVINPPETSLDDAEYQAMYEAKHPKNWSKAS